MTELFETCHWSRPKSVSLALLTCQLLVQPKHYSIVVLVHILLIGWVLGEGGDIYDEDEYCAEDKCLEQSDATHK